jgi:LEA14-like dessication related protein
VTRILRASAVPIVAVLIAACSRPEPPTIVPERVRLTSFTLARIDLDVTLAVTNPNAIDLVARNLTAHVVIGGQFDVGTVEIPVTTALPAGKTTKLDVPLSVKVEDVAPLARLAMTSAKIPYTVDGTVGLGGDLLHVQIPYHLADAVPRDQIVRATISGIPGLGAVP